MLTSAAKGIGFGVVGTMVHNFFVDRIYPRLLTATPFGMSNCMDPYMSHYGGGYGGYGSMMPSYGMAAAPMMPTVAAPSRLGWWPQTEGEGENENENQNESENTLESTSESENQSQNQGQAEIDTMGETQSQAQSSIKMQNKIQSGSALKNQM